MDRSHTDRGGDGNRNQLNRDTDRQTDMADSAPKVHSQQLVRYRPWRGMRTQREFGRRASETARSRTEDSNAHHRNARGNY